MRFLNARVRLHHVHMHVCGRTSALHSGLHIVYVYVCHIGVCKISRYDATARPEGGRGYGSDKNLTPEYLSPYVFQGVLKGVLVIAL